MISGQFRHGKVDIKAQGLSLYAQASQGEYSIEIAFFGSLVACGDLVATYSTKNFAEIVLKHYLKHGTKAFDDLEGGYAFAIYDASLNKVLLVRDRIGTKNIFYYQNADGIVFASTLRQLFLDYNVPAELDSTSIQTMLLLGPARPSDSGVYKNIKTVPAGNFVEFANNKLKVHEYYSLISKSWYMSVDDTIDYARTLITKRTQEYLNVNQPYACFLSGGLDSSVITYIVNASKADKSPINTISVDYKDSDTDFKANSFQPDSDKKYIAIMQKELGSNHRDIILDNETLAHSIKEAAIHRGLPGMADVDSSLLLLCQHTKQEYDIAVSGECADEIFGGYPWYHDESIRNYKGFPWSRNLDVRKNVFDVDASSASEFVADYYQHTLDTVQHINDELPIDRRVRELFVLNLNWFGASLLERKEMMSGAAGLNVHMPFTDHLLVEFAYNLPWNLKSMNSREKGIMRQAFKGLLPNSITDRKKSPYPKSFSPIYLDYVKQEVNEIISSHSPASVLLKKDYLLDLMKSDPTEMQPWYGQLMRLPQLLGYIVQLDTILKEYKVRLV